MAPVKTIAAPHPNPTSVNSHQGSDPTATTTLRATITGRVQGVGFRLFILDAARRLGLGGYVQNQYDGSVYVVAHGSRNDLDQLLDLLWRGPAGAHVSDVRAQWAEGAAESAPARFEVRH